MRYTQEQYKKAWLQFTDTGEQDIIAENNIIIQSWKRSRALGLSAHEDFSCGKRLTDEALAEALRKNKDLLTLANPYIDLIYSTIKSTDVVMSLASPDGMLLHVVGDSSMYDAATRRNIVPGALRTEDAVGTNAVGLAQYYRKQISIRGYQHYNEHFHTWACATSPIWDEKQNIFGFITITCGIRSANLHTLSLARSLAEIISTSKSLQDKNDELLEINQYLEQVMQKLDRGVIILDADKVILAYNHYAASIMDDKLGAYVGKPISELFLEPVPDFISKGEKTTEDMILKTKPRTRWCEVDFSPIQLDDRLVGYMLLFMDLSKRNLDAHRIAGNRVYYHFDNIIGEDPVLLSVIEQAKLAAPSKVRILLQGESGTGKELFAQSIHNESNRKGPFVPINCATIPGDLFESELFGYAPGSFTGALKEGRPGKLEVANHGTVFLDEIADMPWDMQTNLLRVLQDNYIVRLGSSEEFFLDIRYIFATNEDLEAKMYRGEFRKDLYYRINVFSLKLPPLRERKNDIPLLVNRIAEKLAARFDVPMCTFGEAVMDRLIHYAWPGNIRQLENVLERLLLLSQGEEALLSYLPEALQADLQTNDNKSITNPKGRLAYAEKREIENTLLQTNGNISAAAKLLGISRKTLYIKLKEYQVRY